MAARRGRVFARAHGEAGFTLTQLMVVSAILLVVTAGIISSHLFGLKMAQITQIRLGANTQSRAAITLMSEEVRDAKNVQVGSGSATAFVRASDGAPQSGNAVQIYIDVNTNLWVRYYWDTADKTLKRLTNGTSGAVAKIAGVGPETNFSAEDATGNTLTNRQANFVFKAQFQFIELKTPNVSFGGTNLYNYLYVTTRVTCRSSE